MDTVLPVISMYIFHKRMVRGLHGEKFEDREAYQACDASVRFIGEQYSYQNREFKEFSYRSRVHWKLVNCPYCLSMRYNSENALKE